MVEQGLRERKKARTRALIQAQALRLFAQRGYGGVTCEEIAAAAEVSPATFFRYFPTKEDVVLSDEYDPAIAEAVRARPPSEPPLTAVREALAQAFTAFPAGEPDLVRERTRLILSVPALRARSREQLDSLRLHVGSALADRMCRPADALGVRVLAAAVAAVMALAVEDWARGGGDLRRIVDDALAALQEALA